MFCVPGSQVMVKDLARQRVHSFRVLLWKTAEQRALRQATSQSFSVYILILLQPEELQ